MQKSSAITSLCWVSGTSMHCEGLAQTEARARGAIFRPFLTFWNLLIKAGRGLDIQSEKSKSAPGLFCVMSHLGSLSMDHLTPLGGAYDPVTESKIDGHDTDFKCNKNVRVKNNFT